MQPSAAVALIGLVLCGFGLLLLGAVGQVNRQPVKNIHLPVGNKSTIEVYVTHKPKSVWQLDIDAEHLPKKDWTIGTILIYMGKKFRVVNCEGKHLYVDEC